MAAAVHAAPALTPALAIAAAASLGSSAWFEGESASADLSGPLRLLPTAAAAASAGRGRAVPHSLREKSIKPG